MQKILLTIFLISSFILQAQNTRDVVYLKNGSVIKGKITEMNPSENLKIETSDGSLFVYQMSEIKKMEKEEFVGKEVNQKTTSMISQSTIDKFFSNWLSKNRPALKFIGVSKKNGVKREIYGQKIYEIEYELIFETKQDIYINATAFGSAWANKFVDDFSYALQGSDGYESALAGAKKRIPKGQRFVANGSLSFEETDNGWRSSSFKNENYKTVASNYVSSDMMKRQAEERAKLAAELKVKLDWKKEDTEPAEFISHYFKVDNVPLFSYGNIQYKIEPISSYSGRNDVASSIQNVFYQAIESTNREQKSDELSYSSSLNQGLCEFKILKVDFPFKNTGYQCNILISGKISGAYNEPENFPFDYSISLSAKSNRYKKNLSKNQAFASALDDLKAKVRGFIFQYEPIVVEFIRVETNKRGKVNKIVFKKPSMFLNTRKMKFVVMKPSDLGLRNNKFVMTAKVGDCMFKGEINGDEIICNVSGGKNKKAFAKLIDSEEKYIALSSF